MDKLFNEDIINRLSSFEVDLPENDWSVLASKIPVQRRVIPLWYYCTAASIAILIGVGILMMYFNKLDVNKNYSSIIAFTSEDNYQYRSMPTTSHNKQSEISNTCYTKDYSRIYEYDENASSKTKSNSTKDSKTFQITSQNNFKSPSSSEITQGSIGNNITNILEREKKKSKQCTTKENIIDENKSLEDYQKEIKKVKLREKAKKQRKELKAKNTLLKDYYAMVNSSVSAISGGSLGKDTRMQNTVFSSTDGKIYISGLYHSHTEHFVPVSFGINMGIPIIKDKLSVNMGIKYTYLYSKTSNLDNFIKSLVSTNEQHLHYIGIPVALTYNFFQKGKFRLYVSGGVTIDKGISHNEVFRYYLTETINLQETKKNINGLLYSFNIKTGVSIKILKGFGAYIEPELSYYIPNIKQPQPTSKITQSPLNIGVSGGLRWDF